MNNINAVSVGKRSPRRRVAFRGMSQTPACAGRRSPDLAQRSTEGLPPSITTHSSETCRPRGTGSGDPRTARGRETREQRGVGRPAHSASPRYGVGRPAHSAGTGSGDPHTARTRAACCRLVERDFVHHKSVVQRIPAFDGRQRLP